MEDKQGLDKTECVPEPRLIPHVVSQRAANEPQSIWASIPKSSTDASAGYEDITFARLNYAVTRAACWLREILGPLSMCPFEPLAYIGLPDTRYIILAIAAIKVGAQMLFLSPRNSDEAQQVLINQAKSRVFLCSKSMETRITKLLKSHSSLSAMSFFIVPEQEDLLKDDFVPDYPYERSVEEARKEPLLTLHTSSTTGIPKTIPLNQGYGLHEDVVQHVPKFHGLDVITRKPFYGPCRMFVSMPLYHAGGVLLVLLKSLYHDIVSIFQPADLALNGDVFDAILRYGKCTGCVIPPYLLEEMLSEPRHFDTLASLDFVQFGSGPLSKAAGAKLLTRQKNCPHYIGSSECGLYILLELDDPVADWQYFRFHPWSGVVMRPIDHGNDMCELVVVQSETPHAPGMQPVFELFPHIQEWETRDLYVRHPTKPDHWRYMGRNDDVLVLSNGEKLNPVDTEGRLVNAHPSITGALVLAQGLFAPGLLLEVRDIDTADPAQSSRFIEEVWPLIHAANKDAPGHGRLSKELVLLTGPVKPFLRTPKLSVRRKPTTDLFADEIARMYERYSNDSQNGQIYSLSLPALASVGDVEAFLSKLICSETGWEYHIRPDDDLFMLGIDSLHVTRIARVIRAALAKQGVQNAFDMRIIYKAPTLKQLSAEVFHMLGATANTNVNGAAAHQEDMKALIEEYSDFATVPGRLRETSTASRFDESQKYNVLLTGSTGSLGSHILLALLMKPQFANVYCLNRAEDAKARQLRLLSEQGIDESRIAALEQRIHFLHSKSLGAPKLGLDNAQDYDLLKHSGITHIIHNAWPVNFNIPLNSFKSHIAGVRALVDFCATGPEHPKLIFVSSLSSMTSLSSKEIVPETIVSDLFAPSPMGYGESKYVAEHVLDRATQASQGVIATAILRIGQIAGPIKSSKAAWPAREWLPSLVISSQTIRALPATLGRMDQVNWVPVDLLAESITELLDSEQAWNYNENGESKYRSNVYHAFNPNAVAWAELLPSLQANLGNVEVLSLKEWVELVRLGPEEDSSEHRNPARKILPFYEGLVDDNSGVLTCIQSDQPRFELKNMARCSDTFRNLRPISGEWLTNWSRQWL